MMPDLADYVLGPHDLRHSRWALVAPERETPVLLPLPRRRMRRRRGKRLPDSAFVPSLSPTAPALRQPTPAPAPAPAPAPLPPSHAAAAEGATLALRRAAVHLLSGGLAAGLVRTALQPLDTAKTRLQAAKSARAVLVSGATRSRPPRAVGSSVLRTVLAGRGPRGLYKGLVPGVAGIVPAAAVYMLVFQTLKTRFARRAGPRWRNVAVASAAAVGDVAASLVRVPCEVAKQRLQVGVYASVREAAAHMLSARNIPAMYTGLGAQLARDVPFAVAEFVVYDNLKMLALRRNSAAVGVSSSTSGDRNLSRLESLLVGGTSGVVAALVSNPSDVVKTRLMTQVGAARRYNGFADAFRQILADEGVGAFAKGLAPRVAAKALQSACFFATYELLRRTFATALQVDMSSRSSLQSS